MPSNTRPLHSLTSSCWGFLGGTYAAGSRVPVDRLLALAAVLAGRSASLCSAGGPAAAIAAEGPASACAICFAQNSMPFHLQLKAKRRHRITGTLSKIEANAYHSDNNLDAYIAWIETCKHLAEGYQARKYQELVTGMRALDSSWQPLRHRRLWKP